MTNILETTSDTIKFATVIATLITALLAFRSTVKKKPKRNKKLMSEATTPMQDIITAPIRSKADKFSMGLDIVAFISSMTCMLLLFWLLNTIPSTDPRWFNILLALLVVNAVGLRKPDRMG